jgi:hypothetical protein
MAESCFKQTVRHPAGLFGTMLKHAQQQDSSAELLFSYFAQLKSGL